MKVPPVLGFGAALLGSLAGVPSLAATGATAREDARPIAILFIGDGMGRGIRDAASVYHTGRLGGLAFEQLPVHTRVRSDSLDGLTDSGAAATAMACGVLTRNGRVGFDREDQPCQTVVETARQHGLAVGIVTDDALFGATPAAFTAHARSREHTASIVRQQVLATSAEVMLGGGTYRYTTRGPDGDDGPSFVDELRRVGYSVVFERYSLKAAVDGGARKLWGLFADDDLPWAVERASSAPEPSLVEMTLAAIEVLDRDPDGFLLVVEAGLVDPAAHHNNLRRAVHEVVGLDRAVAAVMEWSRPGRDPLLLVTADHDTGYPRLVLKGEAGELPRVIWGGKDHTHDRVDLFASGPGTEALIDRPCDHRCVHELIDAQLRSAVRPTPRDGLGER